MCVYMYKYVTYTCIWINRKQRLVYPPATLDTLQGGWQGATKWEGQAAGAGYDTGPELCLNPSIKWVK
jgi:hypothetical protein